MGSHFEDDRKFFLLHIRGLVQGVGFRPFIYRLATEMGLKGWVINRNDGVIIKAQGSRLKAQELKEKIYAQAPKAAVILDVRIEEAEVEEFDSFEIRKSESISDEITLVSPDIAVCDDCLNDMQKQEQRLDYPFTNCTNCGPRFTIIRSLPYDRPNTTMGVFAMCPDCRNEYSDILDRRFHAQPVACKKCGPVYKLISGKKDIRNFDHILEEFSVGIDSGGVYAIKGLGGYHLVCDALNEKSVERLRKIKNREGKPFALMAGSIDSIKKFADPSPDEIELLKDWRRPIVLLKRKNNLVEKACNGLDSVGFMLPYLPYHHQIFEKLKTPALVMTSGNLSDEPIVISNEEARSTFGDKVDAIIENNRDIYNRVDDSLAKVVGKHKMLLRRSRGYAPSPILTKHNTEGILAVGAELVNSFCIGKGNLGLMSQYIGDLKDYENLRFFEETYNQFCQLFKFNPDLIVTDLHPDYLSTRFGKSLAAEKNIPIISVQHHHAHIASVLCEKNISDKEVIGISFDGMGAGLNNETWGAEICTATLTQVNRKYYFDFVAQPGGDKASHEPWRMALAYLHKYGLLNKTKLPIFNDIPDENIKIVIHMLMNNLNCPASSSAGRLFDAVAAILGVSYFNSFQAEAPMRLESAIKSGEKNQYPYSINGMLIYFRKTIEGIIDDLLKGVDIGTISAGFHNTIVNIILDLSIKIRKENNINTVVLSGGTFQNSYLTLKVEELMQKEGFMVYLPESIPVNDQGIALGQMAIAAEMRKSGLIKKSHA